jgi:hypothetical protein
MRGWTVKEGRDVARYYHDDLENDRVARAREVWRTSGEHVSRRPDALRVWIENEVALAGYTLNAVIATVRRGRLPADDRPRYDALASSVMRLRDKGVTLDVIGEAIGKGRQSVANLEARGREIEETREREASAAREARRRPCGRHSIFEPDCPACLRNAPEEAVEYSGFGQLRGMVVGGSRDT